MTSSRWDDGPGSGSGSGSGGVDERSARLTRLDRRVRTLERLRLGAGTNARLVALDVELCRMEAARIMLRAYDPPTDDGAHELTALP